MNLIRKLRACWSDFRLIRFRLDDIQAQQERLLAQVEGIHAAIRVVHASTQESAHAVARELAVLAGRSESSSRSLAHLAEQLAEATVVVPREAPLVSVILPTWNRGSLIGGALASVQAQTYPHWECLIVDDGSTDDTREQIAGYLRDPRFRFLGQGHRGVCAARNRGLRESRGAIITYLDSDNRWFGTYLGRVVAAYVDPGLGCAYAMQVVESGSHVFIRGGDFDFDRLWDENYIDMSVISHRREVFEQLGGFDEVLTSLTDWDLVLRYARGSQIRRLPIVGGLYSERAENRISDSRLERGYNWFRVREKHRRPLTVRPRVLYALWHYPQVSESYVRTELRAALAAGVEVEVWSEEDVAVPYASEVPVHRGRLRDAVAAFRPMIVHTHWLHTAEQVLADPGCAGLPLTVRGHGFEFAPDRVRRLCRSDAVAAVFLFPHQAVPCAADSARNGAKVSAVPAAFDPTLYHPSAAKDRRLVLRIGAGLRSKDYETFFLAARACPEHRFVLVVCHAYAVESQTDEIIELHRRLGNPAQILVDLQHEDAADWMARAGLYLHTIHLAGEHASPLGMPISIAEAMATGCHVLARDCAPLREYVGDAGGFYSSAEEAAALVRATVEWSDAEWAEARRKSVNQAFFNHASPEVAGPILATWERLARRALASAEVPGAEREVMLARPPHPQEALRELPHPEVRSRA